MQTMTPDAHGIAVTILIVVALFLFARDRLPLESSSLVVIIVLIVGFHLFPYEVDGEPLDPAQFQFQFAHSRVQGVSCSSTFLDQLRPPPVE